MPAARVSMAEYYKYRDEYWGFCTACQDWTADTVEPDAREYECPVCGEQAVFGAEEALLLELVDLDEEGQ